MSSRGEVLPSFLPASGIEFRNSPQLLESAFYSLQFSLFYTEKAFSIPIAQNLKGRTFGSSKEIWEVISNIPLWGCTVPCFRMCC